MRLRPARRSGRPRPPPNPSLSALCPDPSPLYCSQWARTVKLDGATGAATWTLSYRGSEIQGASNASALGVALGPNGAIYVAGTSWEAGKPASWVVQKIQDVQTVVTGTLVTRYRLYSGGTLEHLYTTDLNEYRYLSNQINPACCGWKAEGAIYQVFSGAGSYNGGAAVPYYRLYNPFTYQHHWTTDANEYAVLATIGWQQEGIDGYVLPSQATGTMPLYRLYINAAGGLHLWTTDANEVAYLTANAGWTPEGIAAYVIPLP